MIKAAGRKASGRRFVILGLSRENCRRLLAGQPIPVDFGQFGIDADVLLCAGETEKDIVTELRKHATLPLAQDWKSTEEAAE